MRRGHEEGPGEGKSGQDKGWPRGGSPWTVGL